jgi:hypothetical protein
MSSRSIARRSATRFTPREPASLDLARVHRGFERALGEADRRGRAGLETNRLCLGVRRAQIVLIQRVLGSGDVVDDFGVDGVIGSDEVAATRAHRQRDAAERVAHQRIAGCVLSRNGHAFSFKKKKPAFRPADG